MVNALRELARAAAPTAPETVLWGGLSYHLAFLGGRVKGAVCRITARHNHVELGLIDGVLLPDPSHLLRGTSKSKRMVRVDHLEDLSEAALAALVRSAVETRPDAVIEVPRVEHGRPTRR